MKEVLLGMGCYWGPERLLSNIEGVTATEVGFAGGSVKNPPYREVCNGTTGHTEVVKVTFDPNKLSLEDLLKAFWEGHDPTQGDRQGNDRGTQYRSAIFVKGKDLDVALASKRHYQNVMTKPITTEVKANVGFYPAHEAHQKYLEKNPGGYCGLKGCGVKFPEAEAPAPNISFKAIRPQLTLAESKVLIGGGTELAFSSDLLHAKGGQFECKGCGQQLFSGDTKFDSGTGWPSFS